MSVYMKVFLDIFHILDMLDALYYYSLRKWFNITLFSILGTFLIVLQNIGLFSINQIADVD